MGILNYDFKIQNCDVGEKNALTNKGFQRIMQEAAITASQTVGYGPNNISQTRLFWVILNWKLQVFKRPKWNDTITIKTWPRNMIKCYSCRDYEAYDSENNLIAIASSKWALLSMDTGIMRIPQGLAGEYQCVDKSVFEEPLEKIAEPENSICTFEYKVQIRDLDTNNHVNNTIYLDYAVEALPKEVYENNDFKNVEIMYKHEAKAGNTIIGLYTELENNVHLVTIKSKVDNTLHAIIKLY